MEFNLHDSIDVLKRTPFVLDTLLRDLPERWTHSNEGGETWSPYDVLGHLIHGEQTDWMARLEIVLSDGNEKTFKSFDRFAQFQESKGKTLGQLLDEFKTVRLKNIEILKSKSLNENDLERKGIHPVFGEVTLRNLLSTWVTHDLDHFFQIVRVMAFQYDKNVGPWKVYLRILNSAKPD